MGNETEQKVKIKNPGNSTLAHLPVGKEAKVTNVRGNSAVTRRLMEMGIVPGVSVKVVKTAPFGCPMEIRVRGYKLAMRKTEAEAIEVNEV